MTLPAKVLAAEFFPTEDARSYFRLLRRLLRRHGIPLSLYGDRHSVFVRNDDRWSVEEQLAGQRQPTQFGRALGQLGITYIAANSRLAGAADLQDANAVLRRFLPDYNRRFDRAPREAETAWRPAPENLDRICCFLHERSVSNDNVVQWEGRSFQIPPQPKRFSFAGNIFTLLQHSRLHPSSLWPQGCIRFRCLPISTRSARAMK